MLDDRVQAGVLPIDWPKFFERIPAGSEPAWLAEMAARRARPPRPRRRAARRTSGRTAGRHARRTARIGRGRIRQQAARVLAMDEAHLPDPRRTLNELGFDSLTAVEFCNRVGRSIGQQLNPTVLFDYPTLESLAGYVVRDVLAWRRRPTLPPPATEKAGRSAGRRRSRRVQRLDDVEDMSEEEMDALVTAQLDET